ncbi:MAG: segregation/condensation protein A [Defluviitaleaceae bacterium]|nr:segregation/condensation protein A [Defluviitaleaceae bacterium]
MNFKLDDFYGPLDLLYQLIRKNAIDIYNIPMTQLTEQYLAAIAELPPDMDGMSEFLVLAATLLEIKSRMLLPRSVPADSGGGDPRENLVRQLIAYKHCQELAETLKNIEDAGERIYKSPEQALLQRLRKLHNPESTVSADCLANVSLDGLWAVFVDVVKRQPQKIDHMRSGFGKIAKERHTIADKVSLITELLQATKQLKISFLFAKCADKEECIVTFLALLELIRRRLATVNQPKIFGEIEVLQCQNSA